MGTLGSGDINSDDEGSDIDEIISEVVDEIIEPESASLDDGAESDSQPTVTKCKFEKHENMALYAHNDKTISEVNPRVCKKLCFNETAFECRSFDFTRRTRSCFLSKSTKDDVDEDDFSAHAGSDYYEKVCRQVSPGELEPGK